MFTNTDAFNQDIGGWNVSNVTDMRYMFLYADAFNQDIGGWDVSSVTDMTGMFNSIIGLDPISSLSVTNYNNLLIGWSSLPSVQPNVRFDIKQHYDLAIAATARGILTNAPNNWTIYDMGGI
jgi:surface protein